jgi:hypothetical protein
MNLKSVFDITPKRVIFHRDPIKQNPCLLLEYNVFVDGELHSFDYPLVGGSEECVGDYLSGIFGGVKDVRKSVGEIKKEGLEKILINLKNRLIEENRKYRNASTNGGKYSDLGHLILDGNIADAKISFCDIYKDAIRKSYSTSERFIFYPIAETEPSLKEITQNDLRQPELFVFD